MPLLALAYKTGASNQYYASKEDRGVAVVLIREAQRVGKIFCLSQHRREEIMRRGSANAAIDPVKEDVGGSCRSLTGGQGVDVAVKTMSVLTQVWRREWTLLKFGGIYVNVAGWEMPFVMPQTKFMLKEITVKRSLSYTHDDFGGTFDGVSRMVTGMIAFEDVVQKGFEELVLNKDEDIKIFVTPKHENLR